MQDLYFTAIVLILCRPLKLLNIFAKHFNYFLIYHDFGVHFERKQKHQWTVIVARQWQKHKAQLEALDVEKSNHSPTTTTTRKKIAHHRSFNISSINLYRYLSSYLFLVPFRLFFLFVCCCYTLWMCASCTFLSARRTLKTVKKRYINPNENKNRNIAVLNMAHTETSLIALLIKCIKWCMLWQIR